MRPPAFALAARPAAIKSGAMFGFSGGLSPHSMFNSEFSLFLSQNLILFRQHNNGVSESTVEGAEGAEVRKGCSELSSLRRTFASSAVECSNLGHRILALRFHCSVRTVPT